VTIKPYFVFVS